MKALLLATAMFGFSISAFAVDTRKTEVLLHATGNPIFDSNGLIIGRVADVTPLSIGSDRIIILHGTNLDNGKFDFKSIEDFDIRANQIYLKTK